MKTTAIIILAVAAVILQLALHHQRTELGYCIQLLDPNVTAVPRV